MENSTGQKATATAVRAPGPDGYKHSIASANRRPGRQWLDRLNQPVRFQPGVVRKALLLTWLLGWDSFTKFKLFPRYMFPHFFVVREYVFLASAAFFILAVLNIWGDPIRRLFGRISARTTNCMAASAIFLSIWFLGLRQIGGYDYSALIESAWVQFSPLVPFRDYLCAVPPLLFLGDQYAFRLFGIRWVAFVLFGACFAVLSFFFLTRQLRKLGFSALGATALALVAELGTNILCSFWWYNPVTSILIIMVFVSALVCLLELSGWLDWSLLGLAFMLLLLAKPNGWLAGLCVVFLLFIRDKRRLWGWTVLASSVLLAATVCWIHGLNPLSILRTYLFLGSTRGNPFRALAFGEIPVGERTIWIVATAILGFLVFCLIATAGAEFKKYWRQYCCCLATGLAGLEVTFTNFEVKTVDLMPLLVVVAVLFFRPWSRRSFGRTGYVVTVSIAALFAVSSAFWSATRLRVKDVGVGVFFEESVALQPIRDGFFRGVRSGPHLIAVLKELTGVMQKNPLAKVFFGPQIDFSYAAFRRNPPRGLPLWWHPGTSFAVADVPSISRAFQEDSFDLLVFLKDDYTRIPDPILSYKDRFYVEVPGYKELSVFARGGQAPETASNVSAY